MRIAIVCIPPKILHFNHLKQKIDLTCNILVAIRIVIRSGSQWNDTHHNGTLPRTLNMLVQYGPL